MNQLSGFFKSMLLFRWVNKIVPVSAFTAKRISVVSEPFRQPFKASYMNCNHGRRIAWLSAGLVILGSSSSSIACQSDSEKPVDSSSTTIQALPFEESVVKYDHYNGVALHLENLDASSSEPAIFKKKLEEALFFWEAEGRKGIWIHTTTEHAQLVPCCINMGFSYHFVKDKQLVLSKWLPNDVPSKLPLGPTHQIGVGTLVLHPLDPTLMLVVQEKTGPAAVHNLWKMPTGLLDPGEDIPDAAARELREETGLKGNMEGIVCFRQAHNPSRSSDLFFVCRMSLADPSNASNWKPQEDEIEDIRWMLVEDYCNQDLWKNSPVYQSLNDMIRKASLAAQEQAGRNRAGMIIHEQLPLGFGRGTNALFKSQL